MPVDKLYFSSVSTPLPPGEGVNEYINNPNDYNQLPLHFREILSNFWPQPFELDGHRWMSVEHYYHAQKYLHTPHYNWALHVFSLDDNTSDPILRRIQRNPNYAKSVGGTTGKLTSTEPQGEDYIPKCQMTESKKRKRGDEEKKKKLVIYKRPKNITTDIYRFEHEFAGIEGHPRWTHQDVAYIKAMCAKFSQNEDLREILLNTGDAQLWHILSRTNQEYYPRFKHLESIRKLLRDGQSCRNLNEIQYNGDGESRVPKKPKKNKKKNESEIINLVSDEDEDDEDNEDDNEPRTNVRKKERIY